MRAILPMRSMANDEGEGRNESNGVNGKKCSQKQAKRLPFKRYAMCGKEGQFSPRMEKDINP